MNTVIEFYIPDKVRTKTIKQFTSYFDKPHCKEIENGIYCYTREYCGDDKKIMPMALSIYNDCAKNLIFNCQQNGNTIKKLIKKVNKGKFNPHNLAYLKPEELDEDKWAKIIARKNTTEEMLKYEATVEWKPCKKCGNTLYTRDEKQTRSVDEASTIFYTCTDCHRKYAINS